MFLQKSLPSVLLVLCLTISWSLAKTERCKSNAELATDDLEKECTDTEYKTYVNCIRKRTKRYTDNCSNNCDGGDDCNESSSCSECDCNQCSYSECDDNCQSCCSNYQPPCTSRTCCQATCHSTCRTSHCRRSCRSRCNQSVERKESVIHTSTGSGSSKVEAKVSNQAKHNITTVINLHNVVNNTNIVDIPVVVNNTNLNNITMQASDAGAVNVQLTNQPPQIIQQPGVPGQTHQPPQPQPQPNCCNLISPRQCVPTQEPPFTRCYHTRSKVCGEMCQSPIMHAEPHRVCEQSYQQGQHHQQTQCHEQVAYIPQPQPRCFSTSSWPYVQCTLAKANCGGCYKHIVQGGSGPSECSNACYEGGIDVGPYYRPGPYYQPSYYVQPACGSGGCIGMNSYGMGMGMGGMGGGMGPMSPQNPSYIESIGSNFDYGPRDLTPNTSQQQHGPQGDDEYFMKTKRNSEEKKHEEQGSDSSVEFTVEELPIQLSQS